MAGDVASLTGRQAGRLAWTSVAVMALVYALLVIGEARAGPDALPMDYGAEMAALIAGAAVSLVAGIVGAIIVASRPTNRLGWLYVIAAPMSTALAVGFYVVRWSGVDTPAETSIAVLPTRFFSRTSS